MSGVGVAMMVAGLLVPWWTGLDQVVAAAVEEWRACDTERLAGALSSLVQPAGLAAIALVVIARRRFPSAPPWRALLEPLAAFAAGALLVEALKDTVDRQRPGAEFLDTVGHSFPSGHVGNTVLAVMTLLVLASRSTPAHLVLVVAIAAPVAAARLLLRQHWATDALGSMLVLGGYGLLAIWEPVPRRRRTAVLATAGVAAALLAGAALGLRLPLPAAGGSGDTLVARTAFGDALREGRLQGTWVPDGPDPRRRSAWTKAVQGSLALGTLAERPAMLRLVGRPAESPATQCRHLEVRVNDAPVGRRLMHDGWRAYTFPIGAVPLRADGNVVTITTTLDDGPARPGGETHLAAFSELTLHRGR